MFTYCWIILYNCMEVKEEKRGTELRQKLLTTQKSYYVLICEVKYIYKDMEISNKYARCVLLYIYMYIVL